MLIDSSLQFSSSQAVTASAASDNIVDTLKARNIGVGEPLYLVVVCTEAMTDASSDSTVTPTLRTSATATAAAPAGDLNGTINTLATLPTFAALSAAGTQYIIPLPPATYLRYLDVYYTVANGNLTTGKFTAFITHDIDANQSYAAGYSVS